LTRRTSSRFGRAAAWSVLLASLAGCRQAAPQPSSLGDPDAGQPLPPLDPPTTSGLIAQRNLDAQIEGLAADLNRQPECARCRTQLVAPLLSRASFFGRIRDLDRAETLAAEAVRISPTAETWLAQARVHAALHEFDEARADIAHALATDGNTLESTLLGATIDDAVGQLDTAWSAVESVAAQRPDITSLGEKAILAGESGDVDRGLDFFAQARRSYRDVSPMPVAFLELQEGLLWERQGNIARARERFETAHRRLPGYVAAVSHLAGVSEDMNEAIALLEPFAESEDPEPAWHLAQLLVLRGEGRRARTLVEMAEVRYRELLARHPRAFADHAARFWLGPGDRPPEALTWARRAAEWRPTASSCALWVDAALSSGAPSEACRAAAAGSRLRWSDAASRAQFRAGASACAEETAQR
jgi:tetratricopeptide (TPR) repeat protein